MHGSSLDQSNDEAAEKSPTSLLSLLSSPFPSLFFTFSPVSFLFFRLSPFPGFITEFLVTGVYSGGYSRGAGPGKRVGGRQSPSGTQGQSPGGCLWDEVPRR